MELIDICKKAKTASQTLCGLSDDKVNKVLITASKCLIEDGKQILVSNQIDVKNAKANGKGDAFIDRLTLTDKIISDMAKGLEQVATLVSPVGKTVYSYENKEQGIVIQKKNVPFGVVGIIYESRPNVTADAFALCFKTCNAVVLKGGSDALESNKAITKSIKRALNICGIDENAISLIESCDRQTTVDFMKMDKYIDVLIPRGGAKLIDSAKANSTIPLIETGKGNCHIFVDKTADVKTAVEVIFNAKTQRYSVCNACESLVIHNDILQTVLPEIYRKLSEKQVEMHCDERALKVLNGKKNVILATEEDFYTEYGGAIISVKTVDNIDEAIEHINEHATHHSESIITKDTANAEKFMNKIDSACVYLNSSTRFSDGFVFGLGAEIGISTQKLHARGPMGIDALVTTKYFITGNGAVRKM